MREQQNEFCSLLEDYVKKPANAPWNNHGAFVPFRETHLAIFSVIIFYFHRKPKVFRIYRRNIYKTHQGTKAYFLFLLDKIRKPFFSSIFAFIRM